jgi:hypothetical protein
MLELVVEVSTDPRPFAADRSAIFSPSVYVGAGGGGPLATARLPNRSVCTRVNSAP